MNMLTKEQGFEIVKKLFKNYLIQDYALDDRSDIRDVVFNDLGRRVFTATLVWNGGTSSDEVTKFHKKADNGEYDKVANSIDSDVFDVKEVCDVIFELSMIVRDFVDVDIKPLSVQSYTREVTNTITFAQCPNCNNEQQTQGQKLIACYKCKVAYECT